MNRDKAVDYLVTIWGYSKDNAEHLYDTIVPKPVVPQYVADWYEEIFGYIRNFHIYNSCGDSKKFNLWFDNMDNLITKINIWADERNLKQADPKIQWMRITEEVGEIRDVLLKPTKFTDPQMALKDAIGDTLVTIIVLAHQLDLDVTECLSIAYNEIKNRKGKIVNGTFVKEEDL